MDNGRLISVFAILGALALLAGGYGYVNRNRSPIAHFSAQPISGPAPLEVTFDAGRSFDPDGTIAAYRWEFGDGSQGRGKNVVHTYQTRGDYQVKLTVRDESGERTRTERTLVVTRLPNQPPKASFSSSVTKGIAPLEVTFDAGRSFDPDGTIAAYRWEFGDGSQGRGKTVRHVFGRPGEFAVSLRIRDDGGSIASETRRIVVDPPQPQADFSFIPGSPKTKEGVLFQAADPFPKEIYQGYKGKDPFYRWSFDGEVEKRGPIVSHTFKRSGLHEVTMTVKNAGLSGSKKKTIEIRNRLPIPKLEANKTSGERPLKVRFKISDSIDPDGEIVSFSLDFGDGRGVQGEKPVGSITHVYQRPGEYYAQLRLEDDDGGSETTGLSIFVESRAKEEVEEVEETEETVQTGPEKVETKIEEPVQTAPKKTKTERPVQTEPEKAEIEEPLQTAPEKAETEPKEADTKEKIQTESEKIEEPLQTEPERAEVDGEESLQTKSEKVETGETVQTGPEKVETKIEEPLQTAPKKTKTERPVQTGSEQTQEQIQTEPKEAEIERPIQTGSEQVETESETERPAQTGPEEADTKEKIQTESSKTMTGREEAEEEGKVTFYVSATAKGEGEGSSEKPFKTITGALQAVEGAEEETRKIIKVGSGTYNSSLGENFPLQVENVALIAGGKAKISGGEIVLRNGRLEGFELSSPTFVEGEGGSELSQNLFLNCPAVALTVEGPALVSDNQFESNEIALEAWEAGPIKVRQNSFLDNNLDLMAKEVASLEIRDNTFSSSLQGSKGLRIYGDSTGIIAENRLKGEYELGLEILSSSGMELNFVENVFQLSATGSGNSILLEEGGNSLKFRDNSIAGSKEGLAILGMGKLDERSNIVLEGNEIDGDIGLKVLPARVGDQLLLDLGGGRLNSSGKNHFKGKTFALYDGRKEGMGKLWAMGNLWNGEKLTGEVSGPAERPPQYKIVNGANGIVFSASEKSQ